MRSEIVNHKDAATRPYQTTKNKTKKPLSKILEHVTDVRITEDDNLETVYYMFFRNNSGLNAFDHFGEKCNKEVPQTRRRATAIVALKLFTTGWEMRRTMNLNS